MLLRSPIPEVRRTLLGLPGVHFAVGSSVAGAQNAAPAAGAQAPAAALPFEYGSNQYREAPFDTLAQLLDANPHERVVNITPGGFLRGVTLQISSTGGVLGTTAALVADSPFSIFSSIAIEDISGGPILYPMNGFAYASVQKYARPWAGDPRLRAGFSNTINPAFTLRLFAEVKDTLGVLANTDARAQYRLRYTLAPLTQTGSNGLVTVSTGVTAPTVTVNTYLETWSSPDLQDLLGNPIGQVPDGLVASRFNMHEIPAAVSGNNVLRFTLTGNEIRCLLLIVRNGNAAQARVDLTDANTGTVRLRLDNRQLWAMRPSQWIEEMADFYDFLGNGTWTREAGVFVIPRYRLGQEGDYWLQTVEQTLLQLELAGADITTSPGTVEFIYDVLAIAGAVPDRLEGI
jgi:hypothetical protein